MADGKPNERAGAGWRDTLNLPDTPFPMRGDLARRIGTVSYTHLTLPTKA